MSEPGALFWPSLYARLAPSRYGGTEDVVPAADASGEGAGEAFGQQSFFTSFETLRRHVETELLSLLNASCLESALLPERLDGHALSEVPRERRREAMPFHDRPEIRGSIVNYGLPAIIGASAYGLGAAEIEARMREAILAFEPRIRPDTMRVEVSATDGGRIDPDGPLRFRVVGEIRGAGESVGLVVDTVWDPERVRSAARVVG